MISEATTNRETDTKILNGWSLIKEESSPINLS